MSRMTFQSPSRHNAHDPFSADLEALAERLDPEQFQALSVGLGLGVVLRPDERSTRPSQYFDARARLRSEPSVEAADFEAEMMQFHSASQGSQTLNVINHGSAYHLQNVIGQSETDKQANEDTTTSQDEMSVNADEDLIQAVESREGWEDTVASGTSPINLSKKEKISLRPVRFVVGILAHVVDLVVVFLTLLMSLVIAAYFLAPKNGVSVIESMANWQPLKVFVQLNLLQIMAIVYALYIFYWLFFRWIAGTSIGYLISYALCRLTKLSGFPSHPQGHHQEVK